MHLRLDDIDPKEAPPTNLELNLKTKGASARQMASLANGRIRVTQGPGKLKSGLIGLFGGDMVRELVGKLNPFAAKDPYTTLECTVAMVDIVGGQATIKPVLVQSEKVTIVADGKIDLGTEGLEFAACGGSCWGLSPLAVVVASQPTRRTHRGPGDLRTRFPRTRGCGAAPRVDDLQVIEGIGPKIAELLRRHGIDSFATLSRADVATLWSILDKGGPRFKLANPGTWPQQALYCAQGDWAGLKRYQDELYAGVQLLEDVPAEVVIDVEAAKAAGFDMKGPDDLEVVEGVGPKIAQLLRQHGVTTFVQLASASPVEIAAILEKGGPNFRVANPGTWPEQAGYCVRNDWAGLKRLQDRLTAGRE